ncbi:leucine--tRNA ligase [Candidatus Daviesbacteria bacterium]|nr:leucine--tRNA ligase [Candidatus Daviesbacteria bacterium]
MHKYIPGQIESKWQKKWSEEKLFSPDLDKAEKPYYSLMMFPYPSAEGLHVGNMYAFTGSDIYSRFKRMQGLDVFEPIGLDGFGIHSENYALKVNEHPMELSKKTEKRFYEQLHLIGNSFDWTRTVETYKSNYYKWTQWLFLQMYKKGLAYRKKASVNWCPKDKTVLADEQVVGGVCERCGSVVEKRLLEQWFFRITDYAERLLNNLKELDWSEKVKIAQQQWIGRSEGLIEQWKVEGMDLTLESFTTWPHTTWGATFMVIAPEHPVIAELVAGTKYEKGAKEFIEEVKQDKIKDPNSAEKKKKGYFVGRYVINPLSGHQMPLYIANFAIMEYGTGIVKCTPTHDQRDFEFAKKYDLPFILVVRPTDKDLKVEEMEEAYTGGGVMTENTGHFEGMDDITARKAVAEYSIKQGHARKATNYHLRDWLISRQRYWGPPIPMIYCDKCGVVPVPEEGLPVELPFVEDFRPSGKGESPLASVPDFYNVKCPNCGGKGRRETDVSDTFLDSAWYFLRYPSTEYQDEAFAANRIKKWLPVNMYIGGAEHSVLHLLYSRFVTMVLYDLKLINFEEPFTTFRAHGLVIKDGAKMSKSKGNIVNPDKYIKEYGADTLRTYLMFLGPYSDGGDFRDSGMGGIYRFLQRVWGLQEKIESRVKSQESSDLRMMHKTIKKVTEDIEQLKYNTAIAGLMEWLNHLSRKQAVSAEEYKTFLLLLAPFAPHITEELWQLVNSSEYELRTNNWSIHKQLWPKYASEYLEEEQVSIAVQINGKVRDILVIQKDTVSNKEVVEKMAKESKKIEKFLAGKSVEKVVYIPGKIISLVVSN